MANLYFSCLLLLVVAGSIQCSVFEAQVNTCGEGECTPMPYCSKDKFGTTFESGSCKSLYWKCNEYGQPLACVCPAGQVFCPCTKKCSTKEEALKCYENKQAFGQF